MLVLPPSFQTEEIVNTKKRRLEIGEPQQGEGPLAAVEAQKQASSGYLCCEVTQWMTYCLLTGNTGILPGPSVFKGLRWK